MSLADIHLIEPSPFPSHQGVASKMRVNCYHGLLNFHSDDIFVDIIALIFAGDAVINILPQIMLAGTRRERFSDNNEGTFTVTPSRPATLLTPRREDNHGNKKTLPARSIDPFSPRSVCMRSLFFPHQYPHTDLSALLEAGKGKRPLDTSGDRSQEAAPSPVPSVAVMPSSRCSASSAPAELLLGANRPG